jgi:hypothetical protein
VIAEETGAEVNSERMLELAKELDRALENKSSGRDDGKAHLPGTHPSPTSPSSEYPEIVD